MRIPRTSIAGAMIAVAVVAVNVAMARVYFLSGDRTLMLSSSRFALMAVAAQFGIYLSTRAGHRRLFWVGFTATGIAAAVTMIAMPPRIAGLWDPYLFWVQGLFRRSPGVLRYVGAHRALHSVVSMLIYFVPQALVGAAGALLSTGVGRIIFGGEPRAGTAKGA